MFEVILLPCKSPVIVPLLIILRLILVSLASIHAATKPVMVSPLVLTIAAGTLSEYDVNGKPVIVTVPVGEERLAP